MKQKILEPTSLRDLTKRKFFEVVLPKLASSEQQLNKSISSLCPRELIEEYWFDLYEWGVMAQCYVIKMPPPFKEKDLDPKIKLAYIRCDDQIIFFNRGKEASFSLSSDSSKCEQFDSALDLNNDHARKQLRLSFPDLGVIEGIVPFTPEMGSCVNDFYIFDKYFIECLVTATVRDFYRFIELFKSLSKNEIVGIDETKLFCLLGTKAAFDCVSKTEKLDEKTPDQQLSILHYLLLSPNCNRELLIHACDKMNCCKRLKEILPKVNDEQFRKFLESLKRIPFKQRKELGEMELLCLLGTKEAFDRLLTIFNLSEDSSGERQRKKQVLRYILLTNDRKLLMYAAEKMGLKLEEAFIGSDFSGRNLRGLNLQGLNFSRAYLRKTDFISAKLDGSDFTKSTLIGAKLSKASLIGTKFEDADLCQVDLFERFLILERSKHEEVIRDKKIVDFIPNVSLSLSLIKEYLIIEKKCIRESQFFNSYGHKFIEFLATISVHDFFKCIDSILPYNIFNSDSEIYNFLFKKDKILAKKFGSQFFSLPLFHHFLFIKADNRGLLFDICREMKCFRVLRTQVMFWLSDEEFQKFKRSLERIPLEKREKLGEIELLCLLGTVKSFNAAVTNFNLKSRSIEERKRMLQYVFLSNDPSLLKHAAKELGLKRDGFFGDSFIDLSSTHFEQWDLRSLRFDRIDVSSAAFQGNDTISGPQFFDAKIKGTNFGYTIFKSSLLSENNKSELINLLKNYIFGPIGIGILTRHHITEVKQVIQSAEYYSVNDLIEMLAYKLVKKGTTKESINKKGALYEKIEAFCSSELGKSFEDFLDEQERAAGSKREEEEETHTFCIL